MKSTNLLLAINCLGLFLSNEAFAANSTAIPYSQRFTVDDEVDGVPDFLDNAPGAFNPGQEDLDNDMIGDPIDPTPNSANPNLGDPGLGIFDPANIFPGGTAVFPYEVNFTPPGGTGYILLDFGYDASIDAIAFGELNSSIDTVAIPASLFTSAGWDLNTPGTYTVAMKAVAPGMQSLYWALPNVTVVPEPAATVLVGLTVTCLAGLQRSVRRR